MSTTAYNSGRLPALLARSELVAPAGWSARATSPDRTPVVRQDQPFRTDWSVTVPASAQPGRYPIRSKVTYYPGEGHHPSTLDSVLEVVVPTPPPKGTVPLSDARWLRAVNGYGPVEIDRSNGESKPGDGNPITINGVVFAKGLGAHAPGTIEYYLGGACTSVRAQVGVDDEKNAGSVTFELWADGTKVADSGRLTHLDPAKPIEAALSGATLLRLVVTDAGDGINSDHADWATPTLTCP